MARELIGEKRGLEERSRYLNYIGAGCASLVTVGHLVEVAAEGHLSILTSKSKQKSADTYDQLTE